MRIEGDRKEREGGDFGQSVHWEGAETMEMKGNREMGREGLGWVVFGVGFVIQTNPKAHSPNMGFVTQYNTTQPNTIPQTPPNCLTF